MNRSRIVAPALLLIAAVCGSTSAGEKPRLRRPVAVALSPNGDRLYVANRESGTVSLIDTGKQSIVGEVEVGGMLSALALSADGKRLLVTDERNHKLVLMSRKQSEWRVVQRLKVAEYPVGVVFNGAGNRCYVSSLWSQSITVVDVFTDPKPRLQAFKTIKLPFAPRRLCLAESKKRLIVAGSFDGSLGVIDTNANRRIAVKHIPGHNIRGLTLSADGKRLLTSQQTLNPLARSTFDDVHWGNMFSNVMYSFSINDVCDQAADLQRDRQATHLGRPGNAAGDPGAIAVSKGRLAVLLSGVGETAIGRNLEDPLSRVSVGKRPTALALSGDGKRVYVADLFSDSVSVIDAEKSKRIATILLGAKPKLSLTQRGEELFFDARLSHDGWMSCHSCHTDGHTNGLLNDNLSDGSFGAAKRVLSLLGVAQTAPWAWNGSVKNLDQQVRNSIGKTMRGKPPTDEQTAAMVAYMKSLQPAPAPARYDNRPHAAAIDKGRRLFAKLDCRRCHTPPTYTSPKAYDIGIKDGVGNSRFNPPSLRGVGRRRKLFHDGRVRSLNDVFEKKRHQLPRAVTQSQIKDLIEFLRTL